MRTLLLASCIAICGTAMAAPTMYADPYPTTVVQPDSASFTVNGGAPIACTLPVSAAGKTPTCDLASITVPGTYTLVMTVTKAAGCNAAGECWPEGSASSAPFAYKWLASGANAPAGLRVAP